MSAEQHACVARYRSHLVWDLSQALGPCIRIRLVDGAETVAKCCLSYVDGNVSRELLFVRHARHEIYRSRTSMMFLRVKRSGAFSSHLL